MIDNNVISIIYYESPCEIQAWSTGYKLIGTAYGFQVMSSDAAVTTGFAVPVLVRKRMLLDHKI